MSEATVTVLVNVLVNGAVTIVTAICAVVVLWLKTADARKAVSVTQDAAQGAKAAATVAVAQVTRTAAVVEEVHKATNGERERLQAEVKALQQKVDTLQEARVARERELPPVTPEKGGEA